MINYKTRLEKERAELKKRMHNLALFMGTEDFETIAEEQQLLLLVQEKAMETYDRCLELRIANIFKNRNLHSQTGELQEPLVLLTGTA